MLEWFAAHQHADGAIPSSPIFRGSTTLVDYNAYWLLALHDYVLYSGDVAFARSVWANVIKLVEGFYVSQSLTNGLLRRPLGSYDYGYITRRGEGRRLLQRDLRLRTATGGGDRHVGRRRRPSRRVVDPQRERKSRLRRCVLGRPRRRLPGLRWRL